MALRPSRTSDGNALSRSVRSSVLALVLDDGFYAISDVLTAGPISEPGHLPSLDSGLQAWDMLGANGPPKEVFV